MRSFIRFSLLTALFVFVSSGTSVGKGLRGRGDFDFFVDVASLPTLGERTIELVQIAVPIKEIKYKEKDGNYQASVRIRIAFRDEEATVFKKSYVVRDTRSVAPASIDLSAFLYTVDSCLVTPGGYYLDIRIEDMQRSRVNLLSFVRRSFLSSELKDAYIEVAAFSPDRLSLSEPVLIWSGRNEALFVPNPIQVYGLKNDTLSFFVSALVPDSSHNDSLDIRMSVLSSTGELMGSVRSKSAVEGGQGTYFGTFDVNTYPAGMYRVLIEALDRSGLYASTGKDFSVAWELVNWQKPSRDILIEARMLFSGAEFDDFRSASIGEQEKILNTFWKKLDPTPHTTVNEAYEKFIERVSYADMNFGASTTRGALTDRGQIYIRLGHPDQITQQNVPVNRTDLVEAIEKLEDRYKIITHSIDSERKRMGYDLIRPEIPAERSRAFRGTEGMDTGAYELWIYNSKGDPIFDRDRLITIHAGLRFLFIDMNGYGLYQLAGTSEDFGKNDD